MRGDFVCALLRKGEYAVMDPPYRVEFPSRGCRVRSVFDQIARPKGVLVALLDPDFDDPELSSRPDAGVLLLFNSAGQLVPVFESANYLNGSSAVITFTRDGAVAVVHQFGYAGDPNWSVEALHVVPATTDQRSILTVLMDVPKSRFPIPEHRPWHWNARDLDGDGYLDIEIGRPRRDGNMQVKATYRYSEASGRYDGPKGSLSGDFYLVPPAGCTWAHAEEFVKAHGIVSSPRQSCSCGS